MYHLLRLQGLHGTEVHILLQFPGVPSLLNDLTQLGEVEASLVPVVDEIIIPASQ